MEFFHINRRLSKNHNAIVERTVVSPGRNARKLSIDSDTLEDHHLMKLRVEEKVTPLPFDENDFDD